MQFLKSLLRGSLSTVFKLSLILLVVVGSLVMTFGTSTQLKQSLKTSKIYDNAVDNIIEGAAKDSSDQADSPFNQPAVQQAAKAALTPVFLQNTSEQIIDGIYGWLQGKTAQPQFNIDVSGVKQQFTSGVADYAITRAKQLPACTVQQAAQLANEKIDPLTVPCLPAGFDVESLRSQVAAQLDKQEGNNKDNILQQSVITPDNLPKDDDGQNPVQKLTRDADEAPKAFRLVTLAPLILGAIALVSGGLIMLLYDDKRRGARHLAITLLVIGIVTLAGILLTNFVFDKLEHSDSLVRADANIKEPAIALVRSISGAINRNLVIFGAVYSTVGAGILLALHFTKPKTPKAATETEASTTPDTTDTTASLPEENTPIPEEKPQPRPRLIQ